MKSALLTSLAILAALPTISFAEDKPLKERAAQAVETLKRETRDATASASKAARQAWNATQAYLTTDPKEFRDGATKKIEELSGDVTALKQNTTTGAMAQRHYFTTRVASLGEQVDFARAELAKLPESESGARYDEARKQLNKTLGHLETAVNQAEAEAGDTP